MEKKTNNSNTIVPEDSDKKDKGMNSGNSEKGKYQSLSIQGDIYQTLLTKKYENRKKWVTPDPKRIYSFIPGTVTDIFVKEGQTVKKGDKLLGLEAMKMLTSIEAHSDAKIKKIHVKVGDRISKGFLMIELV
jgi:biotin carboxyl carrier protein